MVCPIWNGMDTAGRKVCPDSFYTKRAGCNSAEDRVVVENAVSRPQYAEYVNLNASGIAMNSQYADTTGFVNSGMRTKFNDTRNELTGNFGLQFGADVETNCSMNAYERGMAQESQAQRRTQAANEGFNSNQRRHQAGF
jgi:hypothetical protein